MRYALGQYDPFEYFVLRDRDELLKRFFRQPLDG